MASAPSLTPGTPLETSRTGSDFDAAPIKRALDVFLILLTSPVWLPLCWLICGLILWEDGHYPLYRQPRTGRGGKRFYAYKFRTMATDAEAVLKRHLAADPALRQEWAAQFTLRRDPRVTRIGRVLRRASLDELPQVLNVLAGEMALVGPRPLPLDRLERLPCRVREHRERVRPGMTGLGQVSGQSDAGTAGMARFDPYYVRRWSIWLDLQILARTIWVVILGSGAR